MPLVTRPYSGAVHAHRHLLITTGQTKLVADQTLPGIDLGLHERPLSPIGGVQIEIRMQITELPNRLALAFCDDQLVGNVLRIDHRYASRMARPMRIASWNGHRTV